MFRLSPWLGALALGLVLPAAAVAQGGGAVTIADGADVALGSTTDPAGASTVIGQIEQLNAIAASTGTVQLATPDSSNLSTVASNTTTTANSMGAAGSGITQPSGGAGMLGWLSGIFRALTGTGVNAINVQGSVASGSVDDSSKPIKMGCVTVSAFVNVSTGQRQNCIMDTRSAVVVSLEQGGQFIAPVNLASSSGNGSLSVHQIPTVASGAGIVPTATGAAGSSLVLKPSAGNLYRASTTADTTAGFMVLIDATAAPSSGAAISPKLCRPVGVGASIELDHDNVPDVFATGITELFSADCYLYTPVSAKFLGGSVK